MIYAVRQILMLILTSSLRRRSHSAQTMDARAMTPKGTPTPTPIARSWDEGDVLSPVDVGQAVMAVDAEFDDVVIDKEFEQVVSVIAEAFT